MVISITQIVPKTVPQRIEIIALVIDIHLLSTFPLAAKRTTIVIIVITPITSLEKISVNLPELFIILGIFI